MYFNYFPQLIYDMKNNGNEKLVTDLFRRVNIRDAILDEASLYEHYYVPNGETPEVTAFKHFGDTELHWVILLTNDITAAYYGWPLSDQDFEKYVKDKYANPGAVHHYEITQSSGPTTGNGPDDYSHKIEVNETESGAESVSNYDYERREQDKKRQVKLLNRQFLNSLLDEFENLINR